MRSQTRHTAQLLLLVGTQLALSAVDAFAIPSTSSSFQQTLSSLFATVTTRQTRKSTTPRTHIPLETYNDYDLYYSEHNNNNDSAMDDVVSSVQQLSQYPDVLDTDSIQSISQQSYTAGTSTLEQVAMASIPQQLPRAVHRVTPEKELALARTIQRGVALHQIRDEWLQQQQLPASSTNTTTISAKDWAAAANITTKELRRQITAYRTAKHELVMANTGLVHTVVRQQLALQPQKFTKTERDEWIQEGMLGLLRAAELFDPNRGLRFSTYAVVWIKGVLRNSHLTELVRVPAREKTKWNTIVQAQRDILALQQQDKEEQQQQQPDDSNNTVLRVSLEELAQATGFTPQDILTTQRRMNRAQHVVSLDAPVKSQSRSGQQQEQQSSSLLDRQVDNDTTTQEQAALQADVLSALVRNLNDRERRLMRLRYGLDGGPARTLQECAEAMGLSYTRVYVLAKQCLEKLRHAQEADSLEEYLMTIA